MTIFDTSYTSPFFSLTLQREENTMYMKMQTHSDLITTRNLPHTVQILKEVCPRVLKTQCFNNKNLPFYKEVENTEIGHMFEHILLAYLCKLCVKHGIRDVVFNGKTNWNWLTDQKGVFHIYITPADLMSSLIHTAIKKTIYITEFIMESEFAYKKTSSLMATRLV